MNYIPFEDDLFLSILSPVAMGLPLGLVVTLVGALVLRGWKRAVYAVVGSVMVLGGLAALIVVLATNSSYDGRVDKFKASVAEEFSDVYGITVTAGDARDLAYPLSEPEGRTYFGTTILKTGPNVEDFVRVQLAYADGEVFLLQQVGEEYTELETVR